MSDALSWGDANAACLAAGLQLATVQSAAQNALLLTAAAGNRVWIGGTDAASEGAWVWRGFANTWEHAAFQYENWYPGEPNDASSAAVPSNFGGGEDCLMVNLDGMWNDDRCTTRKKYVCQQTN